AKSGTRALPGRDPQLGVGLRIVSEYANRGRARGPSAAETGTGSRDPPALPNHARRRLQVSAVTTAILVVDDDEDCIATLELALGTLAGAVIHPALSAEAALQALESGTFSAVITDIQLPEMTGLELVERIRGNPRFLSLPVVVLSAAADPTTPARALGLG